MDQSIAHWQITGLGLGLISKHSKGKTMQGSMFNALQNVLY